MKRACLIALLCACCAPASGAAEPAAAVSSAQALLTYVAANGGVCLMRADGTHAVRMTPRSTVFYPAWSASGRYVAVERWAGRDRHHDLLTKVNVFDAKGRLRWKFGPGMNNSLPHWAPDGKHIAYFVATKHSGWLAVATPNGKNAHRIESCLGNWDFCPSYWRWSADGTRIAFVSRTALSSPNSVFSARADGSDRRLLVPNATAPAFSPVEPKLAYTGPNGSHGLWSLFVRRCRRGQPARDHAALGVAGDW